MGSDRAFTIAAVAFYFSTNATLRDLDYTSQIASALLRGHLGLWEKPPDLLNEIQEISSDFRAFQNVLLKIQG